MERTEFITYLSSLYSKELEIRKLASKVHEDVNQHYDEHPYFYHLNMVASNVIEYLPYIVVKKEDILPVLFGAYFHDSIEDARLTYNDVKSFAKKYMDEHQAVLGTEIVYALTNEKGRNRQERANERYYSGIRETLYAPLVKACDRLANYEYAKSVQSRMVKCYQKEMADFVTHITTMSTDKRLTIPDELIDRLMEK